MLIPDVQKLINQLGAVNTDLFASRHVRPPTSVLLLPLRASGMGIYGAVYCLSDVQVRGPGAAPPRTLGRRRAGGGGGVAASGLQPRLARPAGACAGDPTRHAHAI